MKLSQWAKNNGITYRTAYSWFKSGKIVNARQMDNGTILVDDENVKGLREYIVEMVELLKKIDGKIK